MTFRLLTDGAYSPPNDPLVDGSGNFLITDIDLSVPIGSHGKKPKPPRGQVHYPAGWHFIR